MAKLVKAGPVIVDLVEESRLRRHLYGVAAGHVEGALAADAKISAGCMNERLGLRDHLALRQRLAGGIKMFGQIIALRDIEDGKALQEGHRLRFVAIGVGALLFVLGNKAVSVNDGGAVLTLPDIAT